MATRGRVGPSISIGPWRRFLCSTIGLGRWQRGGIWLSLALALSLQMVVGGCSSFKGPKTTVAGVVVTGATDEGLELDIYLEMTNENERGIELRLYQYTVWADGVRAYQGVWSAEQTIPVAATQSARIPAVLLDAALGWTADSRPKQTSLRVAGSVLYIAPGRLAETLLEWGLYQPQQPFRAEEQIELIVEQTLPGAKQGQASSS